MTAKGRSLLYAPTAFILVQSVAFASSQGAERALLILDQSHTIPGLQWNEGPGKQAPIIRKCRTPGTTPAGHQDLCVDLHGTYLNQGNRLRLNARTLKVDAPGRFTAEYQLKASSTPILVQSVQPNGVVAAEQRLRIFVPSWQKLTSPPVSQQTSHFSITPGLGASYVSFQQTALPTVTEFTAIGKVSANYMLSKGWYLNGASSCTFAPFLTAPSNSRLNILMADGKAGYQFPLGSGSRWALSLLGGWYYTTTFGASGGFGYHDMMGPEAMLVVGFRAGPSQKLLAFVKPALITSLPTISTHNMEYVEGLGFFFDETWEATFDLAQLSFAAGNLSVQVNSYTFAVNARF